MRAYSDAAVFVRVGESRSFSRAAQTLMLTPSAVSKAVSRLERRLGARLMVRSTRSLRLTELGEEYFERCRDAFEQLERADIQIADSSLHGAGRLRVEMPTTLGRDVIVPALAEFLAKNSSIRLHVLLREQPSDLFRSDVDAAIRIGPLPPSDLVGSRVGEMRRLTCGAPAFIARHGAPATPADLIPAQCLALIDSQSGRPEHWTFVRHGTMSTIVPDSHLALGDGDTVISAAVCGLGYVHVPSLSVQRYIDDGLLQPVLSDWDALLPIYVVYPKHRQQSVKIRAFAEFLKASFARSARVDAKALPVRLLNVVRSI